MSTRSESPSESPEVACSCARDRLRTRSNEYVIAPSRGGGWPAWAEAFARLLDRLALEPAHCVIVTQEPNQRCVQLMIGHGHAHIEVGSNHYLLGDFRLDQGEERLLGSIGFESPDTVDPDGGVPLNWWRDEEHADPEAIAGLVLSTLTAVMGFDARYPISIEVFGADHPCETCFWVRE